MMRRWMQYRRDRRDGGRRSTFVRGVSPVLSHRVGFTLIELLVVIAIIAILGGDSVPRVQSSPREGSASVMCQQHENLGMGMMQYVNDYDEAFPAWRTPFGVMGGLGGVATHLLGLSNWTLICVT